MLSINRIIPMDEGPFRLTIMADDFSTSVRQKENRNTRNMTINKLRIIMKLYTNLFNLKNETSGKSEKL